MDFSWIITGVTVFLSLVGSACVFIVPVLFLVGLGVFMYRRSQQSNTYRQASQAWPTTMGRVLMSSVQSRHTGRSRSTYPVVVYQYEVNGNSFQSQTIKAGEQYLSIRVAGQAQATAARYPVGATVTVYYNPANPAESALER
jgi:hypothetical protein